MDTRMISRRKKLAAAALVVGIVFSTLSGSFSGKKVLAANSDDKWDDFLVLHDTKLYDELSNQGGYERPSADAILLDYKNSSQCGQHPRLMLTSDSVKALKVDANNPNHPKNFWYKRLITRADTLCTQLTSTNNEDYLINYSKCFETRMPGLNGRGNAADVFMDRMMTLGMAYQLTGLSKYAEAAWVLLERVASFPDINPWHDLDFGFFCQGYAIAYDWMYPEWEKTPSHKATLEQAIRRQCFRPANDSYTNNSPKRSQTSDNGLVRGVYTDNNHNPIVNAGVAMVSLALLDQYPTIGSSLCRDAIICLERDLNMFAPDGMTKEGTEYMLLTIDNLSMMFSSLETSIGKLYGLDTCPGMADGKVIRVIHALESDVGMFSFGDSYDSLLTNAGELYFYEHYDLHGFRTDIYNRLKSTYSNDFERNVQILCWYVPETNEQTFNLDLDMTAQGAAAFATFRNNYEERQSYVGVKAGTTIKDFFVHLDEGSFVFNSQGVRWAADMGKDKYTLDGYSAPRAEDNARWKIFRLRPDGHNVLLINPNQNDCGYEFNQVAELSTKSAEKEAMAVVDMTALVSGKATSAKRGFLFTDDRLSLVVRDEVTLKEQSDLYWIMYTRQSVSINGNTAVLSGKNANGEVVKLQLDVVSSTTGKLSKESAAPWSLAPQVDDQNTNDDYTRIVYKISGATGDVNITVKLTPLIDATKDAPGVSSYGPIASWKLDTPTPTVTKKATVTEKPTVTKKATVTDKPTVTVTPAKGSTVSPTKKATVTPTKKLTATPKATEKPSVTPTLVPKQPTATPVLGKLTSIPTETPVPTKKSTPVPTISPEKEPSIADFVERLYTIALNRESEKAGKDFWINEIESGNRTGGDCAHFFLIEAPEFLNRGLSDDDFVETLYKTFFDRDSEAAGKEFWVGELKSKRMSRQDVIGGFIDSKEWCNICATYGVRSGAPNAKAEFASKNAIAFATRLYTCCLDREPENDGLKYWSLALTNLEKTGCEAAAFFFTGDEFVGFGLKNDEYVRRLYTTFMGRDPEASEIAYWVGEISKGTQTKDSVMQFFGSSEEFTNICKKYGIEACF
ncbi:MAG: DUF4214 domain-containing protein [Clostridiales bacterium]|nr:DUF4214 domain-containing protein [Clostridiales bacterium]